MIRGPLIFAALAAGLAAAEPITLDEAIARALAGNRELVTAALNLEASDLSVADALQAFAFTVRPEGRVGTTEDGAASRVGLSVDKATRWGTTASAGAALDDFGPEAAERRSATWRVELRQPLLRGRGSAVQLDAVHSARAARLSALRSYEGRRAALVLEVAQTHQELARLQTQLVYDEQARKRYEQLRRLTQVREKQGRASRVDSLRVDFQYGQAESTLAASREKLEARRADFCELLGLPLDTALEALAGPALELEGVDDGPAIALAFSNRLDYAEARQAVGEARRGTRVARHRLLPTADLVASYGRTGRGDTVDEAGGFEEENWSVGLAGDTDLHRRSERSALRRTLLDAAAAEEALATLEVRIHREVRQAVLAYRRAREQSGFAARNLELAQNRARLARRMFELGRGDNFTAMDAETELLRAQSQQLQTAAEVTVAAFRLKGATGTLVESADALKPRADGVALGQVAP